MTPENIRTVIDRHLQPSAFDRIKEGIEFPASSDSFGFQGRGGSVLEEVLDDISQSLAEDFRDKGWLRPCENNGPRGVRALAAWNSWVEGEDLAESDTWWKQSALKRSPLLACLKENFIHALVREKMALEREQSPDGKIDPRNRISIDFTVENFDRIVSATIARTSDAVSGQTIDPFESRSDYICSVTGASLRGGGTFFAPVLTAFDGKGFSALPAMEVPPVARHLELSLPSGQLVMADWFRIEGFREGLEALVPEDRDFDINSAEGMDARMKAYFETMGLVIVQVGNTSPGAFEDTADIWRMGFVDDDADAFYTPDGERNDKAIPEPSWHTCTDLWANTFADRRVVVDILMASGQYEGRETADTALLAYIEDTYGAELIDMDTDRLHVYAPTGYAVNGEIFSDEFRAGEVEYPDWRQDSYLISKNPLTVDPKIMDPEEWTEGRISMEAEPEGMTP